MKTIRSKLIATAIACFAGCAVADEAALYETAAPKDAVFVRVLAEYTQSLSEVPFAGSKLSLSEEQKDTYIAISASDLSDVTAGSFYSIGAGQMDNILIKEPVRKTSNKVHLILMNLGKTPVRLVVPGRDMEVVAPLQSEQAESRAVNPIEVELAVERVSDGTILGAFEVKLSRGQNLTFVATDTSARLIENTFGPVLDLN